MKPPKNRNPQTKTGANASRLASPMSQRERLLAPFRGERPDRPAWLADLTYWYGAHRQAGDLPEKYDRAEGKMRLHADLDVCVYYHCCATCFRKSYDGVEVETHEKPGLRIRRYRLPKGELEEHWQYVAAASCWAHREYPVRDRQGLSLLRELYARTQYEADHETFPRREAEIGPAGLPICPVPRSPLPALLTDWCGVENTVYLLMDEPETVREILDSIDRASDPAFEAIAAGPAELLHFCDNLDSRNSCSFFEEHMESRYRRRLDRLHAAGKKAVVHLDGGVRGLLPKLAACGFDGIESITPEPVGDVPIASLRELAGNDRTVLWGGLPGAMFCHPWTEADVRRQTREWLDTLGGDGRIVVGSADQVPPDGDPDLCRAVAETIGEWARAQSPLPSESVKIRGA